MITEKSQIRFEGKHQVRELGKFIEAHQGRCFGKPTFKGTRILVHLVLETLAEPKQTIESVANDYRIPVEAVQEALRIAADIYHFDLRLPDLYPDIKASAVNGIPIDEI